MSFYFFLADLIGIAAAALGGYLIATRRELDAFGISVCAFASALAGGITRDTIADLPPFAFTEIYPSLTVIVTLGFAFLFRVHRFSEIERHWLFITVDAIGLVAFTIAGVLVAIKADFNLFGVLLLGFIAAVGGGVVRDILINRVPTFMHSDFYASVTLIVALLLYICKIWIGLESWMILSIGLFGVALRLLAVRFHWQLPKVVPDNKS